MRSQTCTNLRRVGRKRTKNKHLPRHMLLEHGGYYYRGPATDWKRKHLGRVYADAMREYGELYRDSEGSLSFVVDICDRYEALVVPTNAPATQHDKRIQLKAIRAVFGRQRPRHVTPVECYMFRDAIAAKSGAVQANYHLSTLKHMFRKAIEWGALQVNPAGDVGKIWVQPRRRLPTADEFALVRELAPPALQVAMDLALLTSMDRGDIINLKRADCRDDGIHYTRRKTMRKNPKAIIVEWSDELREVIARAKRIEPELRHYIVATKSGKQFSVSGFSTAWQRLMVNAESHGLEERFHFHDIRALSISESESLLEASERAGHSSPELTKRVYRRKPARVKPLR